MDVEAEVSFAVDTGTKPAAVSTGASGCVRHDGSFATHRVTIRAARSMCPGVDREGFELHEHATRMEDFDDGDALRDVYYPEMERLLEEVCGARRVVMFDHTIRSGDRRQQEEMLLREPIRIAHNDYTEWSGPNRLRLALPDEADALLDRRFAIAQVWRATHDPIERDPLAICDASSVGSDQLLAAERRLQHRVGEIYMLLHDPRQRWFYFPRMTRDEALVFKVYDSEPSRARFTPHCSFALPCSTDAPPRRSIEVRALLLF